MTHAVYQMTQDHRDWNDACCAANCPGECYTKATSGPTGVLVAGFAPGSAEWRAVMSASKVASVLNLNPWETHWQLWQRMSGLAPWSEVNTAMARGHYLEPAIVAWFRDQHPEWDVRTPGGTWRHPEHEWQIASPDALVYDRESGEFLGPFDAKTSASGKGWGPSGSAEVPVYYAAQLQWQMHVLGARRAFLGLFGVGLRFSEYEVAYSEEDARLIVQASEEFLASIEEAIEPDLDEHRETYQLLREMHPEIEERDVPLDPELARAYVAAVARLAEAEAEHELQRNRVAKVMGRAETATCGGHLVAVRRARKNSKTPWVAAADPLPSEDDLPATPTPEEPS